MSNKCSGDRVVMEGNGASLGGRVTIVKLKCRVCNTHIMIVPMEDNMSYSISAQTEAEIQTQIDNETLLREKKKELIALESVISDLNRKVRR